MQISTLTRASLALLVLAGCYAAPTESARPQKPVPHTRVKVATRHAEKKIPKIEIYDACPMSVAGTTVTVEDTPTGVAMVFTTTGDLDALRTRVVGLADVHNREHLKIGLLPDGTGGGNTAIATGQSEEVYETGQPEDEAPTDVNSDEHRDPKASGTASDGLATDLDWGDGTDKTYASGTGATTATASPDAPQAMMLTHSKAMLEPIVGGIRLVFIADPENVQALRDEGRLHAEHMSAGRCDG